MLILLVRGEAVAKELRLLEDNHFQDLVARVRNRDEAAAAESVRLYEGPIRRVVRLHLRDKQMRRVLDSMDVRQSVLASFFVRTVLGQYELDTPEKLLNLLTSIARNKVANQCSRLHARDAIFGGTFRWPTAPNAHRPGRRSERASIGARNRGTSPQPV